MIDGKFDVIFRGQIVKGSDLNDVKNNLVSLFKSSLNAVEPLFSGADIKIKKSLDYATAMKYQSALKQAGALAIISEAVVAKPKATFMTTDDEPQSQRVVSSKSIESEAPLAEDGSMSMAEVGSRLMPDKIYEKRDVDTSDLSLASVGERILPAKAPENHPQPSIAHLSLEDV